MSDTQTSRLALPMLQPGQAQKEVYHNEALALLDLAVQSAVVSIGENEPPSAPLQGASWIIGTAPMGAWSDAANQLAGWTAGGWRFVVPFDGMVVWSLADGLQARFGAGVWVLGDSRCTRLVVAGVQVVGARQPIIVPPSGGPVVDSEARSTLSAILAALTAHGLIEG
jgi:hypothetical protein